MIVNNYHSKKNDSEQLLIKKNDSKQFQRHYSMATYKPEKEKQSSRSSFKVFFKKKKEKNIETGSPLKPWKLQVKFNKRAK